MKKTQLITVLVLALTLTTIAHADSDRRSGGFLGLFKSEDKVEKASSEDKTKIEDDDVKESDRLMRGSDRIKPESGSKEKTGKDTQSQVTRATAEIDRRVTSLQNLSTRIDAMKRVSDTGKTALKATIAEQVTVLTTLKAKIIADTDPVVLKEDVASITKSYRIYALVLPQTTILAGADRVLTTVDLMTTLGTKLETRIAEAKTAGKDVTVLETAYAEFKTHIASATTDAQSAISLVSGLKPDNGDTTIAASNKKALTDARAKIRSAEEHIKAARKNAASILAGIKESHTSDDKKAE